VTRRPGATELVRRLTVEHRIPAAVSAVALAVSVAVDEARHSSRGRESRPVLLAELLRLLGGCDRVRAEELDLLRELR